VTRRDSRARATSRPGKVGIDVIVIVACEIAEIETAVMLRRSVSA